MFYVKNMKGVITHFCSEDFERAKEAAIGLKKEYGQNFLIEEVKQVWTTQTLEEAINEIGPNCNGYSD